MKERHKNMLAVLDDLRVKAKERDDLMDRLESAIDHEIQRDIDDDDFMVTTQTRQEHNTLNLDKYNDLVVAYNKAVGAGDDTFKFQGRVLWVGFARRVIDHIYPGFSQHPMAKRRSK